MNKTMGNESKAHDGRNATGRGHEERDIVLRYIAGAGIGLFVIIIVAVAGMRSLFDFYLAREIRSSPPANPLAIAGAQPPEPRLQAKPIEQLQRLRSEENLVLSSYGWVDRSQGVVRIPIERAMELVAERGLP